MSLALTVCLSVFCVSLAACHCLPLTASVTVCVSLCVCHCVSSRLFHIKNLITAEEIVGITAAARPTLKASTIGLIPQHIDRTKPKPEAKRDETRTRCCIYIYLKREMKPAQWWCVVLSVSLCLCLFTQPVTQPVTHSVSHSVSDRGPTGACLHVFLPGQCRSDQRCGHWFVRLKHPSVMISLPGRLGVRQHAETVCQISKLSATNSRWWCVLM